MAIVIAPRALYDSISLVPSFTLMHGLRSNVWTFPLQNTTILTMLPPQWLTAQSVAQLYCVDFPAQASSNGIVSLMSIDIEYSGVRDL